MLTLNFQRTKLLALKTLDFEGDWFMVDFALCLRNLALVLSFSENIVQLESVSEFECDSTIPCPLLSTSTLSAGGVANAYTFKSH